MYYDLFSYYRLILSIKAHCLIFIHFDNIIIECVIKLCIYNCFVLLVLEPDSRQISTFDHRGS